MAGHQLNPRHIDLVYVWVLLAIHFYANKVLVKHCRDRRVIEALNLHHMAPVAGCVANRQKHRLVLRSGAGEGFVAPREPVHRVVCVLQQIGGILTDQPVYEQAVAVSVKMLRSFVIGAVFGELVLAEVRF